ncbi:hypothetical protein QTP70_025606, partial [Hemibagrus guttatus]
TTDEELQTAMAFRGFLQELKSWTLGEIGCAAGLVAFTAGAGYCVYRSLWGERAPPEHTQPPHEPVDLLGESSDTPSVLQVVEPILPLLPTETHPTSSAVVLPLSAGELNSTCCNVEYNTADSPLSQSEPVDIRRDILRMVRGPESRLCWLETAETHRLTLEGFPFQNNYEDSFPGIQVVEPNPQLLPKEHHQESSPILLSVDVKGYFLGMIRGPESRFCWFKTTKTHNFNHLGFPYQTTIEDCFTAIQGEYGKVTELISCKLVETSIFEPLEDYVQTLKKVFCTCLHVARDGRVNISTWEQEQVHSPHSDSEEQYDSEESDESLSQEEVEVPFISGYLTDRGVTDIGLKLHALREAFADAVRVKLAYEDLIWFLKTPSYQDSIAAELSEAYVYHYNFVDVFYELLLFGYITNGSIPDTVRVLSGDLKEVRSSGETEEFNVEVGLHQGSALSPFLFAIVMDQLSEEVRQESPWTMMFADDIVICSESREQVEENLERWRFALERRGMKVSRSKTEYMCVNEREGSGTVRLQGEEVKKVQEFKYLGSTVQSNGECGKEVKKRVQAGWNEWRKVSGVLCDRKISARIKGKVYRTVVRPAMLYGLETVSLRKRQESELEVAELKMLRFSLGVTRLDRIRNEYIRGTAHVGRLGDKVREARLRWFGHVQRRDTERRRRRRRLLERLFALISMWNVDVWEPAAKIYFTVLIDQLTDLAEVLFTQPPEFYYDPAALATTLRALLRQHVQKMMDILEKL